jgi:ketol-acid reductoisomerase
MREVLRDIQSGQFAQQWINENDTGKQNYDALLAADLDQPIEKVGARLRQHMAWLQSRPEAEAA